MGVWPSNWVRALLIEGNKFWFYSLLFSIALGILQFFGDRTNTPAQEAKHGVVLKARQKKRRAIKKKLVADGCDILGPGFVLGWISVNTSASAFASCVSSVIAIGDIWEEMGA
jgi:hypothetical protein